MAETKVMGIINLTDNSFYSLSRHNGLRQAMEHIEQMQKQGVDIVDLGACSTHPDAEFVSKEEEIQKLVPVVKEMRKCFPDIIISIDTFRGEVFEQCYDNGAEIWNDVSAGEWEKDSFKVFSKIKVPYVLMHSSAEPKTMQSHTEYKDIVEDICSFFSSKIEELHSLGVEDIILDLGFGFGKTIEQNYTLLSHQREIKECFSLPVLTGISRKSMIYKPLDLKPEEVLEHTCFLHALALEQGADILRVHDVRQAKECIKLYDIYTSAK